MNRIKIILMTVGVGFIGFNLFAYFLKYDIRNSLSDFIQIEIPLNNKVQYSFDEGMAEYVNSI